MDIPDVPIGVILKAARDTAGLTLSQMQDRLYRSRGYLSNIENGNKPVPADIIEGYETVLGVGDLLSRLAVPQREGDDVHRRVLLHWLLTLTPAGVASPAFVEAMRASILEAIEGAADWQEITAEHGRRYSTTAARDLVPLLLADLVVLRERIKEVPEDIEALRATAHLSTLQAMALTNMGDPSTSARWYRAAHAAARQSGDAVLDVWVSGRQAFSRQYGGGTAEDVFGLTDATLSTVRAPCAGLVEILGARARAFAYTGQAKKAFAALESAYTVAESIDLGLADSPFGVATRLPMIAAYVYSYTGDSRAPEARDTVGRAMSRTSARWAAQVELYEARALVASGDPIEGIRHATKVVLNLPLAQRNVAVLGLARDVLSALPAGERMARRARDLAEVVGA